MSDLIVFNFGLGVNLMRPVDGPLNLDLTCVPFKFDEFLFDQDKNFAVFVDFNNDENHELNRDMRMFDEFDDAREFVERCGSDAFKLKMKELTAI